MKTWGLSKVSSYCFFVWCESGELGGRGSWRFSYVISVVELWILLCNHSYPQTESHLESHETSATVLFCENSQRSWHVDCFRKLTPRQNSDRTPNADPAGVRVSVGWGWIAGAWNLLVCKEVVRVLSNYEKLEILLLVIWEVRIEKDQGPVCTGIVWGKRAKGAVWVSVCGAP